MTDTYPGGVTAEQYVAVLREAAKMQCYLCCDIGDPLTPQATYIRHTIGTEVKACLATNIWHFIRNIEAVIEAPND